MTSTEQYPHAFWDGRLLVDYGGFYVEFDGKHIPLVRLEFLLVARLAKSFGRYVTDAELWADVWTGRGEYTEESVRAAVFRLRKALRNSAIPIGVERMIHVGYRLTRFYKPKTLPEFSSEMQSRAAR